MSSAATALSFASAGDHLRALPQVTGLHQLRRGQRARILAVSQAGDLGEQLMEMGLVAGTEVVLLRRGLRGGALQLGVRGYVLSLRHHDAHGIKVAPLPG